jgi:hypothetical protein
MRMQVRPKKGTVPILSHIVYQLNGVKKSTPKQNRQLNILIGESQQ